MALKKWRWLRIHDRETDLPLLIRILNERLKALADFLGDGGGGGGSASDEINAVEAYLYNAGDPLVAGDSDWVFVPFSFTITLAEIVADIAGSITIDVYASSYSAWSGFTLISAAAPVSLSGTAKAHPPLTGWTKTFSGGTYLRFTVSGTPVSIRKVTVSLQLTLPNSVLQVSDTGVVLSGAVGGVLLGDLPNPGFAEDMATQAELNAEASARSSADTAAIATAEAYAIQRANHTGTQLAATISDFNSAARAQTEAELVAGTGLTITPGSSGATRTLTLAASATSSIDSPPTNPSASDDEFGTTQTGTPTGWTAVNWAGLTTSDVNTTKPGTLWVENPQNAAATFTQRHILKAIPAGDFTIVVGLYHNNLFPVGTGQSFTGISLADGTTAGAGNQVVMFSGFDTSKITRGCNRYTNFTGGSVATYVSTTGLASDRFLRIRRSGTTYFFGWSGDLRSWYEPAGTTAATFTFTPTQMGLMVRNDNTGHVQRVAFEFFRYAASATAVFGWGVP